MYACLVWMEGGGLTLGLRMALLSGRLRDKKLITTCPREHSSTSVMGGARIIPTKTPCVYVHVSVLEGVLASREMQQWQTPSLVALI